MNLENKENTSLENVGNTKSVNPKALLAFEEEETKRNWNWFSRYVFCTIW